MNDYFKVGDFNFEIDPSETYIEEATEDYFTHWNIKISAQKGVFDWYECAPDIRGDKVIVAEQCLKGCDKKTIKLNKAFYCRNEDLPFSLYLSSHSDVHDSQITFEEVTEESVRIKWTGLVDLHWGDQKEYPFEICCRLPIKSLIEPEEFVSPWLFIKKKMAQFDEMDHDDKEGFLWDLEDMLDLVFIPGDKLSQLIDFLVNGFLNDNKLSSDFQTAIVLLLRNKKLDKNEILKKLSEFNNTKINQLVGDI